MEPPYIRVEESGAVVRLQAEVTTVGRGRSVDVQIADPSVSMLHAEIVRRGPYVYVTDLGLSRNGTRVNGRLVARRLLADGDVVTFGSARCRIGGVACEELSAEADLRRPATPELTRREIDVVTSLCRPALSDEAFVAPAAAREIAVDLVVTEAAVKQHLLRLYQKLRIPEGPNRRVRLANEVVALGLVRPLPQPVHPDRPPVTPVSPAPAGQPVPAQPGAPEAETVSPAVRPAAGLPSTGSPGTGMGSPATGRPSAGSPGTGSPGTGSPGTGSPAADSHAAGTPASPAAVSPATWLPGSGSAATG